MKNKQIALIDGDLMGNVPVRAHIIVDYLRSHGGKINEESVCKALNMEIKDIPWGYNIGFARCLGADQKFYLILSSTNALDTTQD
jgi:hypothetical protein